MGLVSQSHWCYKRHSFVPMRITDAKPLIPVANEGHKSF